jgi:hypothetical protein
VTRQPTRKQRADHMAELLADVAAQSLKRGRAKPKAAPPPVVAVNLAFTPEQASAFLLYLERGGMTFIGTTLTPALRAEIEGAIWSAARQFRAAGITTEKDEGQGRA